MKQHKNIAIKNTVVKNTILVSALVGASFFNLVAHADGVKSVSREIFNESKSIWGVTVECDTKTSHDIQQSINGGQWCSVAASGKCDDGKYELANQLCGGTAAAIASKKPATENKPATQPKAAPSKPKSVAKTPVQSDPEREKLIRQQIEIEEQQILIQQKRLELRRKELDLQKRQNNGS